MIINEAMAQAVLAKGDPLNDRLIIGKGVMREFADEPERQIIGVVGDIRDGGLEQRPAADDVHPAGAGAGRRERVERAADADGVGRAHRRASRMSMSAPIQEQLRQATGLPVSDVQSMEEVVSLSTSRERFNMWLMTVFGSAALLLAAIGIYGLMAYSVEQRTQEIGIRLALGAQATQVKNMVVFQGMRLAVVGVVIGVAAAFGLARFIATFLFGVTTRDPMVFVGVPVLLTVVALVAVWIPARRASRVDPMIALRYE